MKKILFFLLLVIGAILVNMAQITQSYKNIEWNILYNQQIFTWALDYFSEAENAYNSANTYHKLGEYNDALDLYESIEQKNQSIYHNIGNTHYKMAQEETNNIWKRVSILKKALNSYKKALQLSQNQETAHNKALVEKEIQELQNALSKAQSQKQESQEDSPESDQSEGASDEETSWSEESWSGATDQEKWSQESSWQQENKGLPWENWESWSSWEEPSSSEKWEEAWKGQEMSPEQDASQLSPEQQKAINDYANNLESMQWEYWQYYNKNYRENQSRFESLFWNDPFFNNDLLNWNTEKKDW